jgi:serine phosphatase RsbU (regulator of sigma subunit)
LPPPHRPDEVTPTGGTPSAGAGRVGEPSGRSDATLDATLADLSLETLFHELLDRVRDALEADSATVLLFDPARRVLMTHASSGLERDVAEHVEIPLGRGITGRVAEALEPTIVDDTSAVEVVSPSIREHLRSIVAVPLVDGDSLIGVIHVGSRQLASFSQSDLDLVQVVADRLSVSLENLRLQRAEQLARERAEREAARTRHLLGLADDLAEAHSAAEVCDTVCRHAVEGLGAAACIVVTLEAVERLRVEASTGYPEEMVWPTIPIDATIPVAQAARTGSPVWVSSAEELTARYPLVAEEMERLSFEAAAAVPVALGERMLGALGLHFGQRRIFEPEDRELVVAIAQQAAVSLERARLFEAERGARREAERATARLGLIADFGKRLTRSLELPTIAETLVRFAVKHVADVAIVHLVGRDGRVSSSVSATRDAHGNAVVRWLGQGSHPDLEDPSDPVAWVIRDRQTVFEPEGPQPAGPLRGCSSTVATPLARDEAVLGVLILGRTEALAFEHDDVGLVEELGSRAAQALDNARLYEEQATVADTLQRSLLPPSLPSVPGILVGARYRPAGDGMRVGGDFYDVFEVEPGEWGIVIGDVCGKGAPAAAVMALARYTLRTAALNESKPSAILGTLNEALLRQASDDRFCTVCYVRLRKNPEGVRLTVSSGGHPLPIVLRRDGALETVGRPGTLLGNFPDPRFTDQVVDLAPGDTLVLYTDGVTDERREGEEFGDARLGEVMRECVGLAPQRIADRIESAVVDFRDDDPRDDIAIVTVGVVT